MSHDPLKIRASRAGSMAFGSSWQADSWAVAPGRIELIGNHVDYNGGPVLAAAINRVVVVGSGSIDAARHISMAAADVHRQKHTFDALGLGDWHAGEGDSGPLVYLKGVVSALNAREIPFRTGVGLAISGDVPRGFGMSSSAALCVATILALTIDELDPLDMVAIAREAEHRAGSPVGAMDQSASVAGEVVRFDGRDNSYTRISPKLGDFVFAVASSGVGRSLRTSSYATRVRETEEARQLLAEVYGLDLPGLSALAPHWDDVLPTIHRHLDETLLKRVRHVVSETHRVGEAEIAMRLGAWDWFGKLMNTSGESSARDYEISHPRVEELVHLLRDQDGVMGARMMGGGEGGPALALLHKDAARSVSNTLMREFYNSRKTAADTTVLQRCVFGPGAHREND